MTNPETPDNSMFGMSKARSQPFGAARETASVRNQKLAPLVSADTSLMSSAAVDNIFGMSKKKGNGSSVVHTDQTRNVYAEVEKMEKDINSTIPLYPLPVMPDRYEPTYGRYNQYMLPDIADPSRTNYYPRATTIAKTLDDTSTLDKWKTSKMMEGLVKFPELLNIISDGEGNIVAPGLIDRVSELAQKAAGATFGSDFGTAVHAWTEALDLNAATLADVPETLRAHVATYVNMRDEVGLIPVDVECIVYNPVANSAGRIDRISRGPDGVNYIVDVKTTNNLDAGLLGIAVQLAQYATAQYRLSDDGRTWLPMTPVSKDVAFVAHIPCNGDRDSGDVVCDLIPIDLQKGIAALNSSVTTRETRREKKTIKGQKVHRSTSVPADERVQSQILESRNVEDLDYLYRFYNAQGLWKPEYTEWGMAHLRSLGYTDIQTP